MRGESKGLRAPQILGPMLKSPREVLEEKGAAAVEKKEWRERQLGHLRAALYIIELSGLDDLGHGRIIRILPETI